jgi:transposase
MIWSGLSNGKEGPAMSIVMIGLDTAKLVFQLHGIDSAGKLTLKRRLSRNELVAFLMKQPACTVALEACGASHHWARTISGLGHDVRLVAPEAIRPFVKKGKKNDAADAAAICAAASQADVKYVPIKTVGQQATLALHSVRALLVKQRTMLANAARGLAAEFGVTVPKGMTKLEELVTLIDEAFPGELRRAIKELCDFAVKKAERIETDRGRDRGAHQARRECAPLGHNPGRRTDHSFADSGDGRRQYRLIQKRAALCGMAWPGAATKLHRRQKPFGPDYQSGQ